MPVQGGGADAGVPGVCYGGDGVAGWDFGLPVKHIKGRKIMAHPAAVVYPSVSNSIPLLRGFLVIFVFSALLFFFSFLRDITSFFL